MRTLGRIDTSPVVGSSWPDRIFRKVDFPGPVGADDAVAVAPEELQVHVGEQRGAAVIEAQVGDSDHRLACSFSMLKVIRGLSYHSRREKDSFFFRKSTQKTAPRDDAGWARPHGGGPIPDRRKALRPRARTAQVRRQMSWLYWRMVRSEEK